LLLAIGLVVTSPRDGAVAAAVAPGHEKFDEARLAALRKEGRPVFLYFTADWCLTCKVNEAAAIDRSEVRDAFKAARVTVLAGDWTNGDPAITRFLESRGRAGVPLYLWYSPGKPPEELPQVLTPAMLIDRARSLPKP
ncbi:MAG: thioredoxin family protein, partial [Sphingomicrobium sp.]